MTTRLPMAQERVICWLSEGQPITRDQSPPNRWWRRDGAHMFHVVGKASVYALVCAGKVRMEEVVGEPGTSHRLVLTDCHPEPRDG